MRWGVREFVAVDAAASTDTISQRRVAMEVAGLAVGGEALRRSKLTDEQVPLPFNRPKAVEPSWAACRTGGRNGFQPRVGGQLCWAASLG